MSSETKSPPTSSQAPLWYLYIDDEDANAVEPYADEVMHHTSGLRIEVATPRSFDDQLQNFNARVPDGILLDLRLDREITGVGYRATSLAQEFRTRATEKASAVTEWFGDRPIVLWSTDEKLRDSFTPDNTGHDLFDLRCVKDDIANDEDKAALIGRQMKSLAAGYHTLSQILAQNSTLPVLWRALGFSSIEQTYFLDPRIQAVFERRDDSLPAHEYARFIVSHLLEYPGPLIDEELLAARLGLDRRNSEDFTRLLSLLESAAAYKGVFAEGWPRWWANCIESWWNESEECPGDLQSLTAKERSEFLQEITGLKDLVPAVPIREKDSPRFWTVCHITRQPIDPRDGYILDIPASYPWQDRIYVSAAAALDGTMRRQDFQLDPLERERFKRALEIQQKMRDKTKV